MSDKDWAIYITDILYSIQRLEKTVDGETLESFQNDVDMQDIVMRRFQIIGEAARKVPQEIKEKNPDVPWHKIISMRNVAVHEYGYIDYAVVWETVKKHP